MEEFNSIKVKKNDLKVQLMHLKLQVKLGGEEKSHKIKVLRRSIARLSMKLNLISGMG